MTRTILFALALWTSSAALAAPPAIFLKDAIQGNYSETVLGRMIQNRGSSNDVRRFGAMLVRDHSNGLAQAQTVANRERLRIPATLAPEARSEQRRLQRMNGPAFDREIRRYMIEDHQKDIAKFQAQARSGDRPTASYAAATLPVLRQHLQTARSLRA
jgi:putative membrane protein